MVSPVFFPGSEPASFLGLNISQTARMVRFVVGRPRHSRSYCPIPLSLVLPDLIPLHLCLGNEVSKSVLLALKSKLWRSERASKQRGAHLQAIHEVSICYDCEENFINLPCQNISLFHYFYSYFLMPRYLKWR